MAAVLPGCRERAEAAGPGGRPVTAGLRVGDGVRATVTIAAEITRRVLARVKPGVWIAGRLFGAALVTGATGARVTMDGQWP